MQFELPHPSATVDVVLEDGAAIRVRRHGLADGVRVLLAHGNGFAADAYFPYWQHLMGQFELLVFDFRNHGQNRPTDPANHNYAQFTRDLERVVRAAEEKFGAKPTVGIFHSLSARAAMKHALEIGCPWDALVLFDPPNMPPPGHPAHAAMEAFEHRLIARARNRRRYFATIDELADEYRRSRAARHWIAGAHELMARCVLRQREDGDGYALVCTPENEAAIHAESLGLKLWPRAAEFGAPIKLIGCDPNIEGAPPTGAVNRALAAEGSYDYTFLAGAGHLLQIEKPQECVRLTLEFLAERGLA
jgi:pimeloyl-ACP methyl ester carboxylesterase